MTKYVALETQRRGDAEGNIQKDKYLPHEQHQSLRITNDYFVLFLSSLASLRLRVLGVKCTMSEIYS